MQLELDWGDIELAFRDATGTESYLDTESGEVLALVPGFSDEDDLRSLLDAKPDRFVPLEPIDAAYSRQVMRAFIADLEASPMRRRLERAARHEAGSLTRCLSVLRDDEPLLARYYRFEQTAFWSHVESSLSAAGVVASSPPPSVELFEGFGSA